jgi:hypothetical protein
LYSVFNYTIIHYTPIVPPFVYIPFHYTSYNLTLLHAIMRIRILLYRIIEIISYREIVYKDCRVDRWTGWWWVFVHQTLHTLSYRPIVHIAHRAVYYTSPIHHPPPPQHHNLPKFVHYVYIVYRVYLLPLL